MTASDNSFHAYRFKPTRMPAGFALAVLFMAAACLVGAQSVQTICTFNYTNGAEPVAVLTQGVDGNFYGTTSSGGANDYGTVFMVTPTGTLTTLFSFTNWANPSSLTPNNDGNFYGTTGLGGVANSLNVEGMGTIFQVTTNGNLTTLATFNFTNGATPNGLTLGNDGNFYGTTSQGGNANSTFTDGMGTVFKVTTNGALTTLAIFNGTSGVAPSALTLGNDGNFYGTTSRGGNGNSSYRYGIGTILKVTTNGGLATLISFNFTNGIFPNALTLDNDGSFYGTTMLGGIAGYGTIFQVMTNGTLATLYSFTNQAYPRTVLTLGNDGNFYGSTSSGGANGYGTVFMVTPTGTVITLVSFSETIGSYGVAGLTLGSDGHFYGTAGDGGLTTSGFPQGMGTLFRLLLPPTITSQPQSQTNHAGATVTFSVKATSLKPIGFQWQKNGTNLADGGSIFGATNGTLTITGISDSDAGYYSVVVSNDDGSVSSSVVILTVLEVPSITAQPTNLLVLAASNVVFGVTVAGTLPLRYQWLFNNTSLLHATNTIYRILSVETTNAGNYSVVITNAAGSVTSSIAALTVVLSPASRTNYANSTATFNAPWFGPESLNYQWQRNGANLSDGGNISGATSSSLTIGSVSDTDAANYRAVVSNAFGSVTTSNATLTVNDSLVVVSEPQSQTVLLGGSVSFSFTVYGAAPFVFQWYFNGSPLSPLLTQSNVGTITLPNVNANQAGYYQVEAINANGGLWSSDAYLTVLVPPTLSLQVVSGYPLLNLEGILGYNYRVQYSTNLAAANWTNLLSLTNLSISPYQFLDPSGVGQPSRFYRAFFTQ
jgi:uncharacterized repeat protein (TIGR03803 family)